MQPQTPATGTNFFQQRFETLQKDLQELQRNIEELAETAESEDKLVSATVGARGELRELTLDPRIYRNTDAQALATKITETIWDATRAVTTRLADLTRPMLGDGANGLESELANVPPKETGEK